MKTEINLGYATYEVEVQKGKSISVFRKEHSTSPTVFEIGDEAEYDSYNLKYTGIIRSITEKTVTIEAYPNSSMAKKHRLKLDSFAWRNWNFDSDRVAKQNAETMMYI